VPLIKKKKQKQIKDARKVKTNKDAKTKV